MWLIITLPRLLKAGAGLLLLSGIARADMFNYNSSCIVNLDQPWSPAPLNPGTGTGPPVSYSGTAAGTNGGCSFTGSTGGYTFTASASAITASISGGTLTLSNSNSENIGFDLSPTQPIASYTDSSGNYVLFGYAQAGVQGSFSGTFELTGPGVLSGAIGIAVPPSIFPALYECDDQPERDCHRLSIPGGMRLRISWNPLAQWHRLLPAVRGYRPFHGVR
jgi:hypothetical protein